MFRGLGIEGTRMMIQLVTPRCLVNVENFSAFALSDPVMELSCGDEAFSRCSQSPNLPMGAVCYLHCLAEGAYAHWGDAEV